MGFFAPPTPPLKALRLIISDAATRHQEGKAMMVNDVARACFEATARRTICVELLEEESHEGDDVGLLLQYIYGTRDASANQGGAPERQVQHQHALPRDGGHKGYGSWR